MLPRALPSLSLVGKVIKKKRKRTKKRGRGGDAFIGIEQEKWTKEKIVEGSARKRHFIGLFDQRRDC